MGSGEERFITMDGNDLCPISNLAEDMEYILESFRDASPAKHWLAMIIFKSRLYFDIKRPPIIGSPTIGGYFKVRVFFFVKK